MNGKSACPCKTKSTNERSNERSNERNKCARCTKPNTCTHLLSLRQQQLEKDSSTRLLHMVTNYKDKYSKDDIFYDCLSTDNDSGCKSKKSGATKSDSSRFDDKAAFCAALERVIQRAPMMLKELEQCRTSCNATLEITARLISDSKDNNPNCRYQGKPVTMKMPLEFDPNTGQMATKSAPTSSRHICEKPCSQHSEETHPGCPALIYMQDERPPLPTSDPDDDADTDNDNTPIRSQKMQTDQSYLQDKWRPDRTDFEQESNNVSEKSSRKDNQRTRKEANNIPSKPSQTDTSFLYDQYMRKRGENKTQDSPSQTDMKQDLNTMGNIRYPTHYGKQQDQTKSDQASNTSRRPSLPTIPSGVAMSSSKCSCKDPQPPLLICPSKSMPAVCKAASSGFQTQPSQDTTLWYSLESDISTPVFCPIKHYESNKPKADDSVLFKCSYKVSPDSEGTMQSAQSKSTKCTCKSSTVKSTQSTRSLPCGEQNRSAPCVAVVYCPLSGYAKGSKLNDIEMGKVPSQSVKSDKSCACANTGFLSMESEPENPVTPWQSTRSKRSCGCNEFAICSKHAHILSDMEAGTSSGMKSNPIVTSDKILLSNYSNVLSEMEKGSERSNKPCSCGYCQDSKSSNTDQTTSRSRSVMAKVTCLCSPEQRANLGETVRQDHDGLPFARLESSQLAAADPCLVSNFKSCNVTQSQGTKVVFKADGFCDCPSSSQTSLEERVDYVTVEGSSRDIGEGKSQSQRSCGNKSTRSDQTGSCCKDDYKSTKSDQFECPCNIKTSKYDDFSLEPESVGVVMSCNATVCTDKSTFDKLSKQASSQNCDKARLMNLVNQLTNKQDSSVNHCEVAQEIMRELTLILRKEEKLSKPPKLSYEDCMEAVTRGERSVSDPDKSQADINRKQYLDRMEQYMQTCYPPKKTNPLTDIEIGFEIDPDFDPHPKRRSVSQADMLNNANKTVYNSCHTDVDGNYSTPFEASANTLSTMGVPSKITADDIVGEGTVGEPSLALTLASSVDETDGSPQPPNEEPETTPQVNFGPPQECQTTPQTESRCPDEATSQGGPKSSGDSCQLCELDANDPLCPLTDRERLLCEYLLKRMCQLCDQDEDCGGDGGDHSSGATKSCLCCHCRGLICDNQCKTVSKVLDAAIDPVAEMKFFIDSIVFDLQAMEHVMKKNQTNPYTPKPSSTMGNAPGDSFPATIQDVSSLGCRALYVRWELHDCLGVGGYEIYVDGHLTNRFYSHRHEAGVVSNVDVTKRHQVILRATAIGEEFSGNERNNNNNCNAMVDAHPEMRVGAEQPWTPSVYFYEP